MDGEKVCNAAIDPFETRSPDEEDFVALNRPFWQRENIKVVRYEIALPDGKYCVVYSYVIKFP